MPPTALSTAAVTAVFATRQTVARWSSDASMAIAAVATNGIMTPSRATSEAMEDGGGVGAVSQSQSLMALSLVWVGAESGSIEPREEQR